MTSPLSCPFAGLQDLRCGSSFAEVCSLEARPVHYFLFLPLHLHNLQWLECRSGRSKATSRNVPIGHLSKACSRRWGTQLILVPANRMLCP